MIESIARPWAFWLLLVVPFVFIQAARSYADRRRAVKLAIATARSFICVLIILELVGVTFWWQGKAGDLHITYVADVSDSVPGAVREQVSGQIAAAVRSEGDESRSSLILFGESSRVVIPFGEGMTPEAVRKAFEPYFREEAPAGGISGKQTDMARALSLALANFPTKAQKRIVLLTDGNETDGDVLQLANAASEQHVQVCPVALARQGSRDVLLARLSVPERIKREEAFEIKCEILSVAEAKGRLKLYINDYLVETRPVELPTGRHVETFRRSLEEGGGYLLRGQFEADFEQPADNDMAYSYVTVPDRPRVLLVSNEDATPLVESLQASRFRVDVRSTVGAPRTMLGLVRYDAIILENVSADEFGDNRLQLLRGYVHEFGGGLVLVGGRHSFGPGGYAGTALEDASPLAMDISGIEPPSTSVVLAVDDSRSMWLHGTSELKFENETFGTGDKAWIGLSTRDKAEFVKGVFKQVVLALTPRDRVGAIGMSSDLLPARWYVRPQRVTDKERLIGEFERSFERRTYSVLYPTLDEARFSLFNDPVTYKQVVLLTDGYVTSDSNYSRFATLLFSDGVSISTVAAGADSNIALLESMARWGGGRFSLAKDFKKFEEVYQKELTAKKKEPLIEHPLSVAQAADSPLLEGLDMNLAPVLFGYVRARTKASAQAILTVEGTSDPLLAFWQFGAGKVVAFTSSGTGTWATLWMKDWDQGYSRFWRQLVRGTLREPGKQAYKVNLQPEGLRLRALVDVVDENENFINDASATARLFYLGERGDIFSPSVSWAADLRQTGPGRYEHEFRPERKGVYLVTVQGKGEAAGSVETSGAIISVPKELLNAGPNVDVLSAIAKATEGEIKATAEEAAGVKGLEERRRYDLGLYAMVLAGLLLVAEVLIRRWPAIMEYRRTLQASQRPAGGTQEA